MNGRADRVDHLLQHEGTKRLVESFFNPERPFEGSLLHTLPGNDRDEITIQDLFAVTLLDVRVGPRGVRRLLLDPDTKAEVKRLLETIPDNMEIWRGAEHLLRDSPADKLWSLLQREGDFIGPVTAGKLLCRKRPRLIPIVDSVVEGIVDARPSEYWSFFCEYLQETTRRDWLTEIRPDSVKDDVTLLRTLDVSLWMWGSQAQATREARSDAMLPPGGWLSL